MLVALNENDDRLYANKASREDVCFCPICRERGAEKYIKNNSVEPDCIPLEEIYENCHKYFIEKGYMGKQ
ncbi:MAG: hypothetical protein K5923_05925 [Clostridia bacterium]|nr:hypothetical protein [Clostridia bacterium]